MGGLFDMGLTSGEQGWRETPKNGVEDGSSRSGS